jgi:hypothetical protein
MWPKIKAVEMEGAGATAAIEQASSLGISTGFMMVRGISDLPLAKGKERGGEERDAWKVYASDVAAAFTIGFIADGLPMPPHQQEIRSTNHLSVTHSGTEKIRSGENLDR